MRQARDSNLSVKARLGLLLLEFSKTKEKLRNSFWMLRDFWVVFLQDHIAALKIQHIVRDRRLGAQDESNWHRGHVLFRVGPSLALQKVRVIGPIFLVIACHFDCEKVRKVSRPCSSDAGCVKVWLKCLASPPCLKQAGKRKKSAGTLCIIYTHLLYIHCTFGCTDLIIHRIVSS